MAEIRNNFIKSRMNKDLDARLVPPGEYRDAQNVSISKSEGEDVGALENILGNISLTDFGYDTLGAVGTYSSLVAGSGGYSDAYDVATTGGTGTGLTVDITTGGGATVTGATINNPGTGYTIGDTIVITGGTGAGFTVATLKTSCNLEVVGKYMDDVNNRIILFLTNFVDTSGDTLSNFATENSINSICVYNIDTQVATVVIEGRFLNFSKTHPIYGVNMINNLLFWTDNRNQPRKINIKTALANTSYYTTEDHISVAKYYPHKTIDLYRKMIVGISITAGGTGYIAEDSSPTINLVGTGTGLTLNVTIGGGGVINGVTIVNPGQGYEHGDQVRVVQRGGSGVNSRLTLTVQDVSTMQDVTSSLLPDGTSANPWYDANWPGDPEYLKDKFVRFSYRFKFDDDEFSLIAPFTQTCFVPEQDGYFISNDEEVISQRTEAEFVQNKISNIDLIINSPTEAPWSGVTTALKIQEIQILSKQSDQNSIKVVDTISSNTFTAETKTQLLYNYQSRKPWKTLPTADILRVSDQAPVRALAQEVGGNRVIYGNYIDKPTPPSLLNYTVQADNKSDLALKKEYQNHTLKQNRTYQVGVILSDRYGRQSTVILSQIDEASTSSTLKGSTLFHPFKISPFSTYPNTLSSDLLTASDTWPGDSLKVSFIDEILSNKSSTTGEPGLFKAEGAVSTTDFNAGAPVGTLYPTGTNVVTSGGSGTGLTVDITSVTGGGAIDGLLINNPGAGYKVGDVITVYQIDGLGGTLATYTITALHTPNPLGWESYKIVVKQTEQDYYNIYFPGILNGYIDGESANPTSASATEPVCHFVLHSDNLNKVPRDLSLVGPNQTIFRTGRPSFEEDPSYYQFVDDAGVGFNADPYDPDHERLLKERDRLRDLDSGSQVTNASVKLSPRVENASIVLTESLSAAGTGYSVTTYGVTYTGGSGSGAGTGLTVSVTLTGPAPAPVSAATIVNPGKNYQVGDVVVIDGGGNNATITIGTVSGAHNVQSYPNTAKDTVTTIGTGTELGLWDAAAVSPYNTAPVFYGYENNPYVAKVQVSDHNIGVTGPSTSAGKLSYYVSSLGAVGADYAAGSKNISSVVDAGSSSSGTAGEKGTGILFNIDNVNDGSGAADGDIGAIGPLLDKSSISIANLNGNGIKGFEHTSYPYTVEFKALAGDSAAEAQITVNKTTWPGIMEPILAIYETEPIESKLDIYWETSSSDLISNLNTAIQAGADLNQPVQLLNSGTPIVFTWDEGDAIGHYATALINPYNAVGTILNSTANTFTLTDVKDQNGTSWGSGIFQLEAGAAGDFRIKTAIETYYGNDPNVTRNFDLYIDVKVPSSTWAADGTLLSESFVIENCILNNVAPTITDPASPHTLSSVTSTPGLVYTLVGNNGCVNTSFNYKELTWNIESQYCCGGSLPVNNFYLLPNSNPNEMELWSTAILEGNGQYWINISLTDAGGISQQVTLAIDGLFST